MGKIAFALISAVVLLASLSMAQEDVRKLPAEIPDIEVIGEDRKKVGGEKKEIPIPLEGEEGTITGKETIELEGVGEPPKRVEEEGGQEIGKQPVPSPTPTEEEAAVGGRPVSHIVSFSTYYGLYDALGFKLDFGAQQEDISYLVTYDRNKSNGFVIDRGFSSDEFKGDLTWSFGEDAESRFRPSYHDRVVETPYQILKSGTIKDKLWSAPVEVDVRLNAARVKPSIYGIYAQLVGGLDDKGDVSDIANVRTGVNFPLEILVGIATTSTTEVGAYYDWFTDNFKEGALVWKVGETVSTPWPDRLMWDLGARIEALNFDFKDWQISPLVRGTYSVTDTTNIYAAYVPFWKRPTFDELYIGKDFVEVISARDRAEGGLRLPRAERSYLAFEVGSNLISQLGGVRLGLRDRAFFQDVRDFIVWYDEDGDTLLEPHNVPRVRVVGIEADGSVRFWEITLRAGAKYQYLRDLENPDRVIPYRPEFSFPASIRYESGATGFGVENRWEAFGPSYWDYGTDKSRVLPSYVVGALRLSQKITEDLRFFIEGSRASSHYITYKYEAPLWSFVGGVQVNF
ncbi:MAG: TonB-dependent receptor domain-containing protein [bacterium]